MTYSKFKFIFIILCSISLFNCNNSKTVTLIKFENDSSSDTDSAKTINSIRKIGNLLCMNYSGSYEERLEFMNNWFLSNVDTNYNPRHNIVSTDCSIFTVINDSGEIYLGRNLDENDHGILLAKYAPPGKYSSFAFSRLELLKFDRHSDPTKFTQEEKLHFLFFPFYALDGINEKGLAVGVAGVNSQKLGKHSDKELVFITLFIRRILDDCKNVDEVIELSKNIDLYDGTLSTISHHLLVADQEGNSLIIEYKNGEMKYIKKKNENQLITNRYVYDNSIESNMKCWRYKKLYEQMDSKDDEMNRSKCMRMLESVYNETTWSVVYDVKLKKGLFAIYNDYNNLYEFHF